MGCYGRVKCFFFFFLFGFWYLAFSFVEEWGQWCRCEARFGSTQGGGGCDLVRRGAGALDAIFSPGVGITDIFLR